MHVSFIFSRMGVYGPRRIVLSWHHPHRWHWGSAMGNECVLDSSLLAPLSRAALDVYASQVCVFVAISLCIVTTCVSVDVLVKKCVRVWMCWRVDVHTSTLDIVSRNVAMTSSTTQHRVITPT